MQIKCNNWSVGGDAKAMGKQYLINPLFELN